MAPDRVSHLFIVMNKSHPLLLSSTLHHCLFQNTLTHSCMLTHKCTVQKHAGYKFQPLPFTDVQMCFSGFGICWKCSLQNALKMMQKSYIKKRNFLLDVFFHNNTKFIFFSFSFHNLLSLMCRQHSLHDIIFNLSLSSCCVRSEMYRMLRKEHNPLLPYFSRRRLSLSIFTASIPLLLPLSSKMEFMSPCISLRQTDDYTQRPRRTYTAWQSDCSFYATLFMLCSHILDIIAFQLSDVPVFSLLYFSPFQHLSPHLLFKCSHFPPILPSNPLQFITPTPLCQLHSYLIVIFTSPAIDLNLSSICMPYSHCGRKACEISQRVRQHQFPSAT